MGEVRVSNGNTEARKKTTPHVVVLTTSPQGHLAPAFYLSMEVARQGILVTLVSFQTEIDQMISKHQSEIRSLKLLRFLGLPRPQGIPVTDRDLMMGTLLQKSFDDLNIRERLGAAPERPTCIVATMFYTWAKQVALDLQIPRYYVLLGAGATLARFIQASRALFYRGEVRIRNDDLINELSTGQINAGAGVPHMNFQEFPTLVKIPPVHLRVLEFIEDAHGVLLNSFQDLEPQAMDALRKFKHTAFQKFYAIGPLDPILSVKSVVHELQNPDEDCLRWLDKQPPSSVVFVCLGSFFGVSPRQTKEIAIGLERSKQRFLWVLPADYKASTDLLPVDFEERVAEHGYLLEGWAPQIKVLSHPSTGAFLTHCGWNSVLEAVSRSMPMIAFPIAADQFMNGKYLVDELKVAAEIRRDRDDIPEPNAVERAIRQVMEEEEKAMKGRMQVLRAAGAAALEPGGSSVRDRHEFVEDVRNL